MLFNSFEYLIFFPVVTLLYFALPHQGRWGLLLVSSCLFYMVFKPEYILILIGTIIIDYYAGIYIAVASGQRRKFLLMISLVANISILAIFKYFNFLSQNLTSLAHVLGSGTTFPILDIILPIGLSFHTFQAMSYTIEVYRGHQQPEKHFGIYALYVLFYPQLVAGPIERPQNLLHQFHEKHSFDYERVVSGMQLMAWGMFKKVVIADRLSILVDNTYGQPEKFHGVVLLLATFAFAYQIYCDFSGYSDIAIGAAQVMGINLMKNFDSPYCARSISEFWRRWHISLSTWFKDYFYISLGGSKVSVLRWQTNLFLTFLLSGLWHGANWTYIIWGGLNGLYLIVSIQTEQVRKKIKDRLRISPNGIVEASIQTVCVFLLISFTWIFFRANSLIDAQTIITKISHAPYEIPYIISGVWGTQSLGLNIGISKLDLLIACGVVCLLEIVQFYQRRAGVRKRIRNLPFLYRWVIYFACITALIALGKFQKASFIYFQF